MPNFYIPLSGLDADSTALNTIANNLSNMSTTGFKAQTTNFSDLFYQQVGTTGSGDDVQVGTGVQVSSNSTDFTGGSISSTGVSTDAAINGGGFFVLDAGGGQQLYTRDGNFQTSSTGTLESTEGQAVMGYVATNGIINTSGGLADLTIPTGQVMQPSATNSFSMTQNLDSESPAGTQASGQVQVYDSLGKSYEATVTYTNLGDNKWSYAITLPDTLSAAAATAAAATTMAATASTPTPTSVAAATTAVEPATTVAMPVSAATVLAQSTSPSLTPAAAVVAPITNPAVTVNVDTTTVPGTTTTSYTFAATGTAGVGSTLQFATPAVTHVPAPSAGESLINYAQALQTAVGPASGVTVTATGNVLSISGATGLYTTTGAVTQDVTETTTNYNLASSNGALAQIAPSTSLTVQIGATGPVISAPAFAANESLATYAQALQTAVGAPAASGVTINGSNGILSITGPSNMVIGGNLVQNFSGTQTNFALGSYTDPTTGLITQAAIDSTTSLTFVKAPTASGVAAASFTVTPSNPAGESLATYVGDVQAALTANNVTGVTVIGKNGVLSIAGPSTMTVDGFVNQDVLGTIAASAITPTSPITLTTTPALPAAVTTPASSSTTSLTASAPTISATSNILAAATTTVPTVQNTTLTATTQAGPPSVIAYSFAPTGTASSSTVLEITDGVNTATITPPADMTPVNFATYVNGQLGAAGILATATGVNGAPGTNTNGTLTITGNNNAVNLTVKNVATTAGVSQDVAETTTNYNMVTSNGALATVDPATTNLKIQISGAAAFVPPSFAAGESITSYATALQSALPANSGVVVTAATNALTGLPTGLLSITGPANMTITGNLGQDFNATNLVYNFGGTGTVSPTSNLKITGPTTAGTIGTTALPNVTAGESVTTYATDLNKELGLAQIAGVTVTAPTNPLTGLPTGQLMISGPSSITTSGAAMQDLDLTTTNYNFVTSNGALATVNPTTTLAISEAGSASVSVPAFTTSQSVSTYAANLQAALTSNGITDVTVTGTGGVLSITGPANMTITGTVDQAFSGAQSSFDFGSFTDPNTGLTTPATVAPSTSLTITGPTTAGGSTTITVTPSNPAGESVTQYVTDVQNALAAKDITGVTVTAANGVMSITGPDTVTIAGNVSQNMLGTTNNYAFETNATVDPTTNLTISGETASGTTATITAPSVSAGETVAQYATALTAALSTAGIANATVSFANGQLSITGANLTTTGSVVQGLADTTINYNFGSSATVDPKTTLTIQGPTVSGTPPTAITVAPPVTAGETVAQYAAALTNALKAANIDTGPDGVSVTSNGGQLSIVGPAATLKTAGTANQDLTANTINYNFGTSGSAVAGVDPKTNLTITGQTATGATVTTIAPTVTLGETLAQYVNALTSSLTSAGIAGVTVSSTAAGQLSITGANMSTAGSVIQDPVASANATGTLTFDSNGNLVSPSANLSNVTFAGLSDNAAPLNMSWDLFDANGKAEISQTAAASAQSAQTANGYTSGEYQSFTIGSNGSITAIYSNGQNQTVGQIGLATVANLQGLNDVGSTEYEATTASGLASVGVAGTGGLGTLEGSSLEASNVNISQEFSDLIVAQRAFEANAKSVTTFDTITQETINMIH